MAQSCYAFVNSYFSVQYCRQAGKSTQHRKYDMISARLKTKVLPVFGHRVLVLKEDGLHTTSSRDLL